MAGEATPRGAATAAAVAPTTRRHGAGAEREGVTEVAPGVYITVSEAADGTRELKRVRFSRRKFTDVAAQQWWEQNRASVMAAQRLTIRSRGGGPGSGLPASDTGAALP